MMRAHNNIHFVKSIYYCLDEIELPAKEDFNSELAKSDIFFVKLIGYFAVCKTKTKQYAACKLCFLQNACDTICQIMR